MQFQRLMADHGVVCSMSRSGNVWDNAAMKSFFSSLKTERTARKTHRTRDQARADVFDYIERFYNSKRRYSTIGYLSPVEFEKADAISLGCCQPNRVQARSRGFPLRQAFFAASEIAVIPNGSNGARWLGDAPNASLKRIGELSLGAVVEFR